MKFLQKKLDNPTLCCAAAVLDKLCGIDCATELFADYGSDNFPLTSIIAELAQVYALPCSEVQTAVGDRECQA